MKLLGLLLLAIWSHQTFASETSVYDFSWLDQDKEIYVLQNRKFRKVKSLYVGGTFGKNLAGAFIDSTEFNISGGFFFTEAWGIELTYTQTQSKKNATSKGVNEQGAVAFSREINSTKSAMLLWAPFYAKINTFNKVFYFDWIFGLGLAQVSTTDNRNEFPGGQAADVLTKENLTGVGWMSGLRFYLSQSWSTRLDFRATHLNATTAVNGETDTAKKWAHYYNLSVGINYTF